MYVCTVLFGQSLCLSFLPVFPLLPFIFAPPSSFRFVPCLASFVPPLVLSWGSCLFLCPPPACVPVSDGLFCLPLCSCERRPAVSSIVVLLSPSTLPFSSRRSGPFVWCILLWSSCLRSSSLSALCDFLFLSFLLLAVLCAYVVGGCSCGVVMLCLRCPCLLSLLGASSPKGASAHVKHASSLSSPLAALVLLPLCPVMVGCARVPACVPCVHACAVFALAGMAPYLRAAGLDVLLKPCLLCSTLQILALVVPMAPKVRGERRAAERADREAAERRVRQRLEDVEARLDGAESLGRNHDQRISFQEAPQRIVLRGFSCVGEFMRARGGDFQLAKRAFIGSLFSRIKGALWCRSSSPLG